MDPVSATIGLLSGITTIVGVIGGSVSTLNTIRVNASDAELNIELLIGQLQTVQAALRQVQALLASLSTPLETHDQQLIFDLDSSLSHCKLLVQYIDNQISKFAWSPGSRIRGQRLITVILEDKATKDCLTRLDHQISALNLCLTAFRCRTFAPTKRSTSLEYEHSCPISPHESTSSSCTPTKTISNTSSSDPEASIRSDSPTCDRGPSPTERRPSDFLSPLGIRGMLARSARLDRLIKKEAVKRDRKLRIIALGQDRSSIVKQLRINLGQKLDESELENYRRLIVSFVTLALLSVVKYVEDTSGGFVSEQSCWHLGVLRQFAICASSEYLIEEDVALAARSLWGNWFVQQSFQNMNQNCVGAYFLKSTARIIHPAYVPSTTDIIRVPESVITVRETRLDLSDALAVELIEPPQHGLAKILSQFEDTDACLAYVDISCYDQNLHDSELTCLQRTLSYLKSIFGTGLFASKAIMLCIVNTAAFEEKLAISPLKACFPEYTGGCDKKLALQFVLKECKRVMLTEVLYTHCAKDTEDPTTVQFVRSKAEGLKTALEVTRYMGVSTSSHPGFSSATSRRHKRSGAATVHS